MGPRPATQVPADHSGGSDVGQMWDRYDSAVRFGRILLVAMIFVAVGVPAAIAEAEDLKRWRFVLPDGSFLVENGTIAVVEGLPSVYSTYVIYFDPYGHVPNRCAGGCTFALDSFQNEEGTTTTSTPEPGAGTSSTAPAPSTTVGSTSGRWSGMTLRLAQLSQNQMQVQGCLNLLGAQVDVAPAQAITASWSVTQGGRVVATGSDATAVLSSIGGSGSVVCLFLANVTGLVASTEYLVSFVAGVSGDMVSGSRTITTSNDPSTSTTTTTTVEPSVTATRRGRVTSTTVPTRRSTTTTSEPVFEDDGELEDDYAEIDVRQVGGRFELRVTSTFQGADMVLRARAPGRRSIVWRFSMEDAGLRRISTTRNLAGYTVTLWVDGVRADVMSVG